MVRGGSKRQSARLKEVVTKKEQAKSKSTRDGRLATKATPKPNTLASAKKPSRTNSKVSFLHPLLFNECFNKFDRTFGLPQTKLPSGAKSPNSSKRAKTTKQQPSGHGGGKTTNTDSEVSTVGTDIRTALDHVVKPSVHHKIVTWNVNGLRAFLKKRADWEDYLEKEDPDVLCLNETKLKETDVEALDGDLFASLPFKSWHCSTSKAGYSGTAIFSKVAPVSVHKGFINTKGKGKGKCASSVEDTEGRVLTCVFEKYTIVATYVPNSGQKLDRLEYRTSTWDTRLQQHLAQVQTFKKPVIWCGDLNVAHRDVDITDCKKKRNKVPGFCDAERVNFGNVVGGDAVVRSVVKTLTY